MASSGWQEEKIIDDYSSNIKIIGNIRIDSISHSGGELRVIGLVAVGGRGTNNYRVYYNNGVQEKPANGTWSKIVGDNVQIRVGGGDFYSPFDVTVQVSAAATSYSFPVQFKACYNSSCSSTYWDVTKYWTITFGSGGTNPSGLSVVYNSSTWNSINATSSLQHWGQVPGKELEAIAVTGSSENDFNTITSSNWDHKGRMVWQKKTTAYSETYNMLPTNISLTFNNPLPLKGMRRYYLAAWANNSIGLSAGYIDMTLRYLPPAPGQFTYTDPGGSGTKTYPVTFTGVPANNIDTYDQAWLSRTIRYKINNGAWTYVDNATIATLDFVSAFNISVPAGSIATIEGWFTYRSNSEVTTITLANTNARTHFYSPLNGQAKETIKFYSPLNGRSKKTLKIYGSEGGVTKKVYEDV